MLIFCCRLGWLLRFISHSVISGFITSSAIVIALSQAKYFLGYNVERSSKIVPLARSIIAGAGDVRLLALWISGCSSVLVIKKLKIKNFKKKERKPHVCFSFISLSHYFFMCSGTIGGCVGIHLLMKLLIFALVVIYFLAFMFFHWHSFRCICQNRHRCSLNSCDSFFL